MSRLQDDPSIVIRPSDKGKRWVVMSVALYEREAMRQLRCAEFYQPCVENLVPRVTGTLTRILNNLKLRKFISSKELMFLTPLSEFKERRFFLLPKLHKTKWPMNGMPPGRPVVSDCGSLTRNVSNFVDHFLKPLCELQDSFLQDSGHLIALLRTLTVNNGDVLFTMDVESLYTNVPIVEGVRVVSDVLLRHPDASRPDLSLLSILKLLLTTNDFVFQDTKWLQTNGVAMGKCFGGSFANLFMASWETSALSDCEQQPSFWRRYQDDIFGVWPHGEESLIHFHRFLNSRHPRIKLSLSYGLRVNFLDLSISLDGGEVQYELYSKDTDSHMMLSPTSHHPSHTFRGIIFGEILRFASHSSSREAFQRSYEEISKVWRLQGYSRSLIRQVKRRVLTLTNQLVTWQTGNFPCATPLCRVCFHTSTVLSYRHPTKTVSFPILHHIDCNTTNVVYLVKCLNCEKCYVGETARTLRTRISQHLDNIRRHGPTLLAQHFSTQCSVQHFFVVGVRRVLNTEKRRKFEAELISLLSTACPTGLNVVSAFNADKTNLVLPFADCARRVVTSVQRHCGQHAIRASFYRSRNLLEHLS